MLSMRPDPEIRVKKIAIPAGRRRTPALVLSPNEAPVLATGVLCENYQSTCLSGGVAGVSAGLCCAISCCAGRLPCGASVNEVPRCRVGHPC